MLGMLWDCFRNVNLKKTFLRNFDEPHFCRLHFGSVHGQTCIKDINDMKDQGLSGI